VIPVTSVHSGIPDVSQRSTVKHEASHAQHPVQLGARRARRQHRFANESLRCRALASSTPLGQRIEHEGIEYITATGYAFFQAGLGSDELVTRRRRSLPRFFLQG
jgi:hypothetical protein